MKHLLIIATLLIGSFSIFSQSQEILWFPLSHRIVTNDAGTARMQDVAHIPIIMGELNRAFAPAGIQFYIACNGIDTIRNSVIYEHKRSNDGYVNSFNIPNTINIYYVLKTDRGGGFTWLPGKGYDFIMISIPAPGVSINYVGFTQQMGRHIHELGHYFNLLETWENYNNSNREHPDRIGPNRNCHNRGDELCCTEADVNMVTLKWQGKYYDMYEDKENNCFVCYLLEDSLQYNGLWYKPDIKNYMSYASHSCQEYFSVGQYARMRDCAERGLGQNGCRGHKQGNPIFNYIRLRAGFSDSFDTLYAYNSDCDNIYPPPYTITHKGKDSVEKCLKEGTSIYFPPEMSMLDSAVWFINGDSVFAGTIKFASDSGDYYFPLWDFSPLWVNPSYNSNYITVEAKLPDGTKFSFRFRIGHCGDCEAIRLDLNCVGGVTPFGNWPWPDVSVGFTQKDSMTVKTIRYGIHICNADNNSIKNIRVKELPPYSSIFDSAKVDLETGKVDVFFTCNSDQYAHLTFPLEICVDFEDGTCCKIYDVSLICGGNVIVLPQFVIPNPVNDMATIGYEIVGMQEGMPLKIYIYDTQGNLVLIVMDAVPTSAIDKIHISTSNLPPGRYYVVFYYGDFVNSTSFIKQ